jgi:hypothetical protein
VASNIELLIFDRAGPSAALPRQAAVVALAGGMHLIPVTAALQAVLAAGELGDNDRNRVRPAGF